MSELVDDKGWRRLRLPAVCDTGGESLEPGTIVRKVPLDQMTKGTHVCRDHVQDDDTDDTRREDEPGDWFRTEFDGECSRGGETFQAEATVRADGDGGHECQDCVMHDDMVHATVDGLCRAAGCCRGLCAQAATFWAMPAELRGEFS